MAPAPRLLRILTVLLCLCALAALGIAAWKLRGEKGDGREAASADVGGPRRLSIDRGRGGHAGRYKIQYPHRDGALAVLGPDNRPIVTFTGLRAGERRAWNDLQLTCLSFDEKTCRVEVEFRPAAACLGPGEFAELRAGLRIELDAQRSVSVVRWDPLKPEILLSTAGGEIGLAEGGAWDDPPYRLKLQNGVLQVSRE